MSEPHTTKQALEALGWRIERRPGHTTWIVRNPEGGVIGDDYPDVRYAVSMAHLNQQHRDLYRDERVE